MGIFLCLTLSQAWAGEGVAISDPWIRAAPPSAQAMAAYMVIENTGDVPKTLVDIVSPTFLKVELHETVIKNGVATMEARKRLDIGPGASVALKPNGYHLMLMSPQTKVAEGDTVPFSFIFSDGTRLEMDAVVRKDGASGHNQAGGSQQHDMPGHDMSKHNMH